MNNETIIWKTDDDKEKMPEFDTTRNIELRFMPFTGLIEVRVTSQSLTQDQHYVAKILTPLEAIEMGVKLIDTGRKQLILEE